MVYLSILEGDFLELIKFGKTRLYKNHNYSFSDSFTSAVTELTQLTYKANKNSVILKLNLNKEIGISSLNYNLSTDNPAFNIIGFYKHKINMKDIETFEAGMELFINYDNILSEDFFESLVCADEDDIYDKINLKGIKDIELNIITDKDKLDTFLGNKLIKLSNFNNFIYKNL